MVAEAIVDVLTALEAPDFSESGHVEALLVNCSRQAEILVFSFELGALGNSAADWCSLVSIYASGEQKRD